MFTRRGQIIFQSVTPPLNFLPCPPPHHLQCVPVLFFFSQYAPPSASLVPRCGPDTIRFGGFEVRRGQDKLCLWFLACFFCLFLFLFLGGSSGTGLLGELNFWDGAIHWLRPGLLDFGRVRFGLTAILLEIAGLLGHLDDSVGLRKQSILS